MRHIPQARIAARAAIDVRDHYLAARSRSSPGFVAKSPSVFPNDIARVYRKAWCGEVEEKAGRFRGGAVLAPVRQPQGQHLRQPCLQDALLGEADVIGHAVEENLAF